MRKTFNIGNCHQIAIKQALLCDFIQPNNQTFVIKLNPNNQGTKKNSISTYNSKQKDKYQIQTTVEKIKPTHFLSNIRNKKYQKYSPDKVSLSKKKKSSAKTTFSSKSPTEKTNYKLKNQNFDIQSSKKSLYNSSTDRRSAMKNKNQIELKNSAHTTNVQSHKRQTHIQSIYRPSSTIHTINYQHNNNNHLISKNNILANFKANTPFRQPNLQYIIHNPPNKNIEILRNSKEKPINKVHNTNFKTESKPKDIYYNRNQVQKQNVKHKTQESNMINVRNNQLSPLKYENRNATIGYNFYKDQQQNEAILKRSSKFSRKSEKVEQLPVIIEESQGEIREYTNSKTSSEQRLFKPVNSINSLMIPYNLQQSKHRITAKAHQIKSINELNHKRASSIKDSSEDTQSQYSQAIFNSSRGKINPQNPAKSGLFTFNKSQSKRDSSFNQSYIFNGSTQYKANHQRTQNR